MNTEQMQEARAIAAQCWCDEETKHLEMNTDLAEAFAKRIVKLQAALSAKSVPVGFCHKETGELKSVITSDDGNESDWLDVYTAPQPADKVRELARLLEWAQQNIDCEEDADEKERCSQAISKYLEAMKGQQEDG